MKKSKEAQSIEALDHELGRLHDLYGRITSDKEAENILFQIKELTELLKQIAKRHNRLEY